MKIRNIDQYLLKETGQSYMPIAELINKDDKLLSKLDGEYTNLVQFKNNFLEQLTSFANDAYNQIFFELLQNAKDEGGTGLWIYFEENKGILFINNGTPFNTIPENRKGSLYSFLGKGVGDKAADSESSGKYGKGSKLIFNLLTPRNEVGGSTKSDSERLAQVMLDEAQAPILYSWTDGIQLSQLKNIKSLDEISIEAGDDSKYPILVKLYLSYFPTTPGQRTKIFDKPIECPFDENTFFKFHDCLTSALNLFKSDELFFNPGSLLYIPAPNSVITELQSEFTKENIGEEIRQTCTMLSQERNIKLSRVYINEKSYKAHDVYSYHLRAESTDNIHNFSIVFNNEVTSDDTTQINFFTDYFPISSEKHGLAYIIACKDFAIGEDRQHFKVGNNNIFKCFIDELKAKWNTLIIEDRERYKSFVSSVATSNNPDKELIKSLHFDILKLVKKHIPTSKDIELKKSSEVIILPEECEKIPIHSFSNYFGLHPDLYSFKKEINTSLDVKSFSLTELFDSADNDKLIVYLQTLLPYKLNQIWKKLEQENETNKLISIPFIPNSKKGFSSLKDFIDKNDYFFCYPTTELEFLAKKLPAQKIICNKTTASFDVLLNDSYPKLNEFLNKNWTKDVIKSKLKFLSSNLATLKPIEKQTLVKKLVLYNKVAFKTFVRSELKIFKNNENVDKTLSNLISNDIFSLRSNLIDSLCIRTEERVLEGIDSYLLPKENYHQFVLDNLKVDEYIQKNKKLQTDILNDLLTLYTARKTEGFILDSKSKILFDGKDWISSSSAFLPQSMCKLGEIDYNLIVKHIPKDSCNTIPYDKSLLELLGKPAFQKVLGGNSLKDWEFEELILSLEELEAFKTFVQKETIPFFKRYKIIKDTRSYKITRGKNVQFIHAEEHLKLFLIEKGYCELPGLLYSLFSNENSSLIVASSDSFISNLIDEYGALPVFAWAVKTCSQETRNKYLHQFGNINISLSQSYEDISLEVTLIDLLLESNIATQLSTRLHIDGKPWNKIGFNNDILCNGNHYELSQLINDDFDQTISLTKVMSSLVQVNNQKKLKENIKLEEKPTSEIKAELLLLNDLDYYKFCFLADLSNNPNETVKDEFIKYLSALETTSIDLITTFELARKNSIDGIGDYIDNLPIFLKSSKQILPTKKELWLAEEYIPEELMSWVKKSDKNKEYLIKQLKLQSYVSQTESERTSIIKEKTFSLYNYPLFQNTLKWTIEKQLPILESSASTLMSQIIKKELIDSYILVFDKRTRKQQRLRLAKSAKCLLEPNSVKHSKRLKATEFELQDIAFTNMECFEKLKEIYPNWDILKIEEALDNSKTESDEWDNPAYEKWRSNKLNNNTYRIDLTQKKVPFEYKLFLNDKEIKSLGTENVGAFGRSAQESKHKNFEKHINIFIHPNSFKKQEIIQILEQKQTDIFPLKAEIQDLVRLLSLINQNNSELVRSLIEEGIKTPAAVKKLLKNNSNGSGKNTGNNEDGNAQVDGLEDMENKEEFIDSLNELKVLFEEYGKETLKKIKRALAQLDEDDDKSIPKILSGYIGEQLFKEWLRYTPEKKAEWVADNKAAYDIEWGSSARVEVKTKIQTLFDDTLTYRSTAVYLRESQFDYVEGDHAGIDYYLAIVSLYDLNLKAEYEAWNAELDTKEDIFELPYSIKEDIQRFTSSYMNDENIRNNFIEKVKFLELDDAKKKINILSANHQTC